MDKDKSIITTCLLAIVLIYFCANQRSLFAARDERSLILTISSEHRPRVLYFYGRNCPACKRYGPIIKRAAAVYSRYMDYQEVDVDDPTNRLSAELNIHSIPATIIFDSYGHIVFGERGVIDEASLNNIIMSVYRSSINPSPPSGKTKTGIKHHKHYL